MWKIGNIEIKNKIVLAPMAGISNYAYMKIAEEMGVGLAFTELISSEALVRGNQKTFEMLKGLDKLNIPIGIQLFGSNTNSLVNAALIVTKLYPNCFIDINMGCPVPKVAVKSDAGSGLLKKPDKVREIVSTLVDNLLVPVTIKIRSGWDKDSINAVQIAKICEESGASLITIHGRTRSQGYSGKADWDIIKQVKDAVSIPVIGNGDAKDCLSAKKMLDDTGVDAVMVGRSAIGNPWIFKEINEYLNNGIILPKPTAEEKINMCLKHLSYLREVKVEKIVCLEMRNHIAWYIKGMKYASEIKEKVYKTNNVNDIITILEEYKERLRGEL